jgi:lipopolysaccharide export system protein LptC
LNTAASPPELHLPDLPEVAVSLGAPARPRLHLGLRYRLRELMGVYLPLAMMALLALGTWWLVKNTPRLEESEERPVLRREPDYEMRDFAVTRFSVDGRATVRIEGALLRHFPDTDRIEIDTAHIHATAIDGRVTQAYANKALVNGDASEWQLSGGARMLTEPTTGPKLELESEFLHAFVATERIRSHLPVRVRRDHDEIRAGAFEFDNLTQRLQLAGPVRARFAAVAAPGRITPEAKAP